MTDTRLPLLDQVRVASPCPMRWEDMRPCSTREGDDRVRHCNQCDLQVFNLSDMTAGEAETLLRERLGDGTRLCAGFYRRADGTILTRDCPVGLTAERGRLRRTIARVTAAFGLAALGATGAALAQEPGDGVRATRPFTYLTKWLTPAKAVAPPPQFLAGEVCITPAPTKG